MSNKEILAVVRAADQAGMSYGKYVAKYGGKLPSAEEDSPKEPSGGRKPKRVQRLSPGGALLQTYPNVAAAAIACGVRESAMRERCNGKFKKRIAKDGFIYQWEPEEERIK